MKAQDVSPGSEVKKFHSLLPQAIAEPNARSDKNKCIRSERYADAARWPSAERCRDFSVPTPGSVRRTGSPAARCSLLGWLGGLHPGLSSSVPLALGVTWLQCSSRAVESVQSVFIRVTNLRLLLLFVVVYRLPRVPSAAADCGKAGTVPGFQRSHFELVLEYLEQRIGIAADVAKVTREIISQEGAGKAGTVKSPIELRVQLATRKRLPVLACGAISHDSVLVPVHLYHAKWS